MKEGNLSIGSNSLDAINLCMLYIPYLEMVTILLDEFNYLEIFIRI